MKPKRRSFSRRRYFIECKHNKQCALSYIHFSRYTSSWIFFCIGLLSLGCCFSFFAFLFTFFALHCACVFSDLCVLCALLMALVMERVNRNKHTKSKSISNTVKPDQIDDNIERKLKKINPSISNVHIVEFISNRLNVFTKRMFEKNDSLLKMKIEAMKK